MATSFGGTDGMKILIADDHQLFLDFFQLQLVEQGYEVLATALNGNEAIEKALKYRPDVIFMDIIMPECDGIEATRQIKERLPECKIVMLTSSEEDDSLFEAIKNGASGYLLKNLHVNELFALLASLERGESILSPGLIVRIFQEFSRISLAGHSVENSTLKKKGLNDRQINILRWVAQGKKYKEIATDLGLSERTIKYHMERILKILHANTKAQAISYASSKGLIEN